MADDLMALNIRDVPCALVAELKVQARARKLTLREFVLARLGGGISSDSAKVRLTRAKLGVGSSSDCSSCGHPVSQHKPAKGSANLFCQAASCACRLTGGGR